MCIRMEQFRSALFSSETTSSFPNYDVGFTRENIRLEKEVLSKLGVSFNE